MSKWYDNILKKAPAAPPNNDTPEQIIERQEAFLALEKQINGEALYAIPWVLLAVLVSLCVMSLFGVA